jgi:hypothetical protein
MDYFEIVKSGIIIAFFVATTYPALWLVRLCWDFAMGQDIKFRVEADSNDAPLNPMAGGDSRPNPGDAFMAWLFLFLVSVAVAVTWVVTVPGIIIFSILYGIRTQTRKGVLVQQKLEGKDQCT